MRTIITLCSLDDKSISRIFHFLCNYKKQEHPFSTLVFVFALFYRTIFEKGGLIDRGKNLSINDKLSDICDIFGDILPKISKKIIDKANFADRIQNYRNRLTHGEISYSEIGNEDLYRACKDMQLILQLSIINNMGFTKNNIKRFYYLDKIHSS